MEQNRFELGEVYQEFLNKQEQYDRDDIATEVENVKILTGENSDILHLATADECVLCTGEKHKATMYGMTDLGHSEPGSRPYKIAGLRKGTVLPVTMHVCPECAKRYRLCAYVPTVCFTLIVLIAAIVLTLPSVAKAVRGIDCFVPIAMRPFMLFALILILSLFLCALVRRLMINAFSKHTEFSLTNIPEIAYLKEKGFFTLYDNKHFPKVLFSKEVPDYLADYMDEHCPDQGEPFEQNEAVSEEAEPDAQIQE